MSKQAVIEAVNKFGFKLDEVGKGLTLETPHGFVFSATLTHEVVADYSCCAKSEAWKSLLSDIKCGIEKCGEENCEWCNNI